MQKEIIRYECDYCKRSREWDKLNPMIGGSILGGWVSYTKYKQHITEYTIDLFFCSNQCLIGYLKENDEAAFKKKK